jgi:hypothetical protein
MKRIFTIAAALFMTASAWAQSPEKMSYQAVVRDASNNLITTQGVGIQISILQGSASGTAVYVERQSPTTNANGLVSLEIGTGTLVSGDFTAIDWANGAYFIKTETDPKGGTTYTITGTSQLMSVPYAFHAKTADSIAGVVMQVTPHYVGELFGGGIVFYVYNKGANGLIASLDDLDGGSGVEWSFTTAILIGSTAQSFYDGASNTTAIVAQDATALKAGTICNSYATGSQRDWYLPAAWELNLLYNSAYPINKILENDGNAATNGLNAETAGPTFGRYWSSTEYSNGFAWYSNFSNGTRHLSNKFSNYSVRAVRAF